MRPPRTPVRRRRIGVGILHWNRCECQVLGLKGARKHRHPELALQSISDIIRRGFSLLYLGFRRLLGLVISWRKPESDKELEIVVLRLSGAFIQPLGLTSNDTSMMVSPWQVQSQPVVCERVS